MNNKYKIIIAVGVFALLAAGCNKASTPTTTTAPTPQAQQPVANQPTPTQEPTPTPADQPKAAEHIVSYTDAGFKPASLTVKKGDTVVFKNTASDAVRVSSNPHPIHNGYPTIGGCISSTFDSCNNVAPGQSWSFKFDIAGSWGYHNHLNPSEGGTIVVQ